MIGTKISHYTIVERIGAGGMGVVYRAHDGRLQRDVAIKFLPDALSHDEEAKARLLREARAASALDHPNICSMYDIGETDEGQLYLVMAHYAGLTLDAWRREHPPTLGDVLDITRQISAGLVHAHEKGVVHRDLKPSNILITEEGVAKILDFGLAKMSGGETLTASGTSLGSPGYMSPEQVRAKGTSERSDVWAMGVMLYELLGGKPPFARDDLPAVLYAIAHEEPAPLVSRVGSLPEGLERLVTACLQKDPEDRLGPMFELHANLEALAGGRAVDDATMQLPSLADGDRTLRLDASSVAALTRSGSARRRRSVIVLGLSLLVLAAGIWSGTQLLRSPAAPPMRVAVLNPRLDEGSLPADDPHAAAGVHSALLQALSSYEGISLIDPAQLRELNDPQQIVAALAPDEMLRATLHDRGADWSISLDRLDRRGSTVLWSQEFSAPKREPLRLASAVAAHLRGAYPERGIREGHAELAVNADDYGRFLEVQDWYLNRPNEEGIESMLPVLDEIRASSPSFLDACLLDAAISTQLYALHRDEAHSQRAMQRCREARALAANDPRPLRALAEIALDANQPAVAADALDEMERLDPGNPDLLTWRARLAQRQGEPEEALRLMENAATRLPTRRNVFELATLQYQQNRFDDARAQLDVLVERDPEYLPARTKLAEIELLHGSIERAEQINLDILERGDDIGALVNLGLTRELLGKYELAAENFRKALEFAPGHPYLLLNLADVEFLGRQTGRAKLLYAQALESFDTEDPQLSWDDRMVVAQCLLRLDRASEAVAAVQDGLADASGESEAYFIASLVYCGAGEKTSAVVNARRALETGTQARWFELPWFDPLRDTAEFAELLAPFTPAANGI